MNQMKMPAAVDDRKLCQKMFSERNDYDIRRLMVVYTNQFVFIAQKKKLSTDDIFSV
jgi:hypothetical protein